MYHQEDMNTAVTKHIKVDIDINLSPTAKQYQIGRLPVKATNDGRKKAKKQSLKYRCKHKVVLSMRLCDINMFERKHR